MLSLKNILASTVFVCGLVAQISGAGDNGERCTVTEGAGISVDSCDGNKFLSCNSGRCQCQDNVNQVYTFKYVDSKSRSRRSPKKGGKGGSAFKSAAIGAGGAFVGYKVGQAVGGSSGTPSISINRNSDRDSSNNRNSKKEFSCYGRVGGECVLDYNQFNIVTTTTTAAPSTTTVATTAAAPVAENNVTASSTTTTEASVNATTLSDTSTTISPLPIPAAQTAEPPKRPQCVSHAVCNPRTPQTSANKTHIILDSDPRIGVCECKPGYQRTNTDLCVKSNERSPAQGIEASSMLIASLYIANKMFGLF